MGVRSPLHESSPPPGRRSAPPDDRLQRGPSTPRGLVSISGALEYWIPAFAGMTAGANSWDSLLPSPLRGGVGGGGLQAPCLWLPPTPTFPRKGGGSCARRRRSRTATRSRLLHQGREGEVIECINKFCRHPRATASPLSLEVRAPFGEPRRMDRSPRPSFEARKSAHLRMTTLVCGKYGH